MFLFLSCLSVIARIAAREANIDNNRIYLLPKEASDINSSFSHAKRSVLKTNDYDDHSGGSLSQSPPIRLSVPMSAVSTTQAPLKVHQPREDPRLFYQSDSYIKEANGQNINHEVSFIYPERHVVRANEDSRRGLLLRNGEREHNMISFGSSVCITCPRDRTLVARAGADRVILQTPRLFSCSGHKAPRNVHFVHIYGPKFGTLIEEGTHLVIGRIMVKNKGAQLCKMQIHVIIQGCVTPNYLISQCAGKNYSFTCRDHKMDLHGQSSLNCGNNLKWTGKLPICRVRTWCEHPPPPEHGRVSCRGHITNVGHSTGLQEGSRCRVRCSRGWKWYPRAIAQCRQGQWTNTLTCQKTTTNKLQTL